ncbi:phytochelatin synthase family protein [Sorangium sp. So ce854]|uniref:phytochelatin synthase family protein n=1 Tax=Sorangium sp. So ce854 TaxID=3133322 RepID=UPI003F5E3C99
MRRVPSVMPSYHKRPLPPGCIAFSSEEGRAVFREALALGTMESFFPPDASRRGCARRARGSRRVLAG